MNMNATAPTEPLSSGELTKQQRAELKRQGKMEARQSESRKRRLRKISSWALGIAFTLVAVGGSGWFMVTRPSLPPTSMQGHIEDMPAAHITDTPIPDRIQRHMLEHADGQGQPGVIMQYNCEQYACEPDLVAKLTALVRQYPRHVYLAPNTYDGKIILTKLNRLQILDRFDEQAIKRFIGE